MASNSKHDQIANNDANPQKPEIMSQDKGSVILKALESTYDEQDTSNF